jgi:hypothetical protein
LGLLFSAACASPSARIADELTSKGFDANQALCVGERLQSNLSLSQLMQLSRAAGALSDGDTTPGRLTASDLFRAASRLNDPKIPIEVAKAARGCGLLADLF